MNSTFCRLNILYFIQAQHLNLLTTIKLTFQKSKVFDFENEGTLTLTRSIIPFSSVEQIDAIDNYKNIIVVTRIVFYQIPPRNTPSICLSFGPVHVVHWYFCDEQPESKINALKLNLFRFWFIWFICSFIFIHPFLFQWISTHWHLWAMFSLLRRLSLRDRFHEDDRHSEN